MPVDTVLPHVVYENVAEALAWLANAFGFEEHYRYGESGGLVQGAQIHRGKAYIMLKSARGDARSPQQLGGWTQSLTVFVENVDAHYEQTKSAGAQIIEELHDVMYGERQYAALDLEGHHWLFSQHIRNVKPEEWGATAQPGG